MAIRPKGKGFVVDVGRGESRVRVTFPTFEEAAAKELEYKMAVLKGTPIIINNKQDDRRPTLQTVLDQTYNKFWRNQKSGLKALKNADLCLGFLGQDTLVRNVTTSMIDDMQDHFRKEGNADSTINRKLSALSCVLSYAVDLGYIQAKPKMHFNRERNNRIRFLTLKEEETLLGYFRSAGWDHIADYFAVCIDTGIRFEELSHVDVARDLNNGLLTLWKTKNGHPRTIPLTDRALKIVQTQPEILKLPKRQRRRVWDAARDYMRLTNDPDFVPYVCRHTCASRLVQRGVNLVVVKEWMGHTAVATTLRYAHICPENLVRARDVLQMPVGVTQVTQQVSLAA